MRIAKRIWLVGLILGFSSNAFAYYCSSPKGNGYVDLGDSMQTVEKVCGNPDNISQQVIGGPKVQQVQYWTYTHQPINAQFSAPPPATQMTYPPNVTFTVMNDKVTSITVQGKQVTSSNLCRTGAAIAVGQDAQSVLSSCGQPSMTNTEQQNVSEPLQTTTTWTYNIPNDASITLTFLNGELNDIAQ